MPLLYLLYGFPRNLFGRHGVRGDPAAMAVRGLVAPVWIGDQMWCFIAHKPTTSWHQSRKTQLKTLKQNFDMILFFPLQDKKKKKLFLITRDILIKTGYSQLLYSCRTQDTWWRLSTNPVTRFLSTMPSYAIALSWDQPCMNVHGSMLSGYLCVSTKSQNC